MENLTVSTDIDAFMGSADNAAARTSLELGTTDAVEFGELATSQFNFPNLTTAELDAVTDAVSGDTYFDSDRGQFVRFTGAASYDVITSRVIVMSDITADMSPITLAASRLFESGFFAGSSSVSAPTDVLRIYTSKDPLSTAGVSYLYHTGEQGTAGWYDVDNVGGGLITGAVFAPDTLMQYMPEVGDGVPFVFNRDRINTITTAQLLSENLQAGSVYKFDVAINYLDLKGSNVSLNIDYSGLYSSGGNLNMTALNLSDKTSLVSLNLSDPDISTTLVLDTGSFFGVAGPNFGEWRIVGTITPSSDGVFSMSIGQKAADVDPLYYGNVAAGLTLLSD